MFQFIGDLIGALLGVAIGAFAFLRPYHPWLSGMEGPPTQIEKRALHIKRCGALIAICAGILFIVQLVQYFFHL